MNVVSRLVFIVTLVLFAAVSMANEDSQVECVVGDDGECIASNDDEGPEDTEAASSEGATVDNGCPDRGHIIRCTGEYLDLNKNGKLDRIELDAAIGSLPWCVREFLAEQRARPIILIVNIFLQVWSRHCENLG